MNKKRERISSTKKNISRQLKVEREECTVGEKKIPGLKSIIFL